MSKLVIVESPTKARTIRNYLPQDHVVKASMGHIRDLPSSASEIPKSYRDKDWSRLGVDTEGGFQPIYVLSKRRKDTVKELKDALKDAEEILIATDEDREGESIGWHLIEVLKPKVPVRRMVFHEITKDAIQQALDATRDIDDDLVRAQETRRILDRLVGYTLSPLLWKKIAPKLSAGRVQSVAVRLLVQRERERHAFVSASYWDLAAELAKRPESDGRRFGAQLESVDGTRLASGKDFDENTGKLIEGADVLLLDEQAAEDLKDRLADETWRVDSVATKKSVRRPYPPFTTSTLQQEAGRKLRMSAAETMRVAQSLYENGHITYHRTDSLNLSNEAVSGSRRRISQLYGDEYLSPSPRRFKTKSKGAQEAHEAIRPAGGDMRPVKDLGLSGREGQLYDLIWKRMMATQMADAQLESVTVKIAVSDALFRANGRRVVFPGFFRAYVEGTDDPEAALEDREEILPPLEEGEVLDPMTVETVGHETKPPARFTEASLVKALEEYGVGRPSTYASIISTVQDRGYVSKQGSAMVPSFTAFAVTELLESDFERLVDTGFTAEMEDDLDRIAEGKVDWQEYLSRFYLGDEGLAKQVEEAEERVDAREASTVDLGPIEVRVGRYGPFLEQRRNGDRVIAALPEDLAPADLQAEVAKELLEKAAAGPESLGEHPETQESVYLKDGPYGPYVQLGEDGTGKDKPKRVSLPKGTEPEDVDLKMALALLDLPRDLGPHPDSGKPVRAGIGRYGPYVVHDGTFASLKKDDDVLTVDLERGLDLLKEKAARQKGKGRSRNLLKELGEHPDDGKPIELLDGRYGPYVRHGRTNATVPKDQEPMDLTLEQAVELIAEKRAKGKGRKKSR